MVAIWMLIKHPVKLTSLSFKHWEIPACQHSAEEVKEQIWPNDEK